MQRRRIVLPVLVIATLVALRLVHLEADTPAGIGQSSMGIYVDEGYKTLDARNLFLFGNVKWAEYDDFAGIWIRASPTSQWLFYLSFWLFGLSLTSARLVTVLFFAIFLALVGAFVFRRYPTWLAVLAIVIMGLLSTLFFFSRVAILIQAIVTIVYLALFLVGEYWQAKKGVVITVTLGLMLAATLLVKPTVLIYFSPLLMALGMALLAESAMKMKPGRALAGGGVGIVLLFALGYLTYQYWHEMVTLEYWKYTIQTIPRDPVSWFYSPLMVSSPALVMVGFVCAGHFFLVRADRIVKDPYRLSLLLMTTLGPLLIFLIPYRPLRYYVPFLPAYLLLGMEWLGSKQWRTAVPATKSFPRIALCLAFWAWAAMVAASAIRRGGFVASGFGGDVEWIALSKPLAVIVGAVLVSVVLIWLLTRGALRGSSVLTVVIGLLALSFYLDLKAVVSFLVQPSYESRRLTVQLQEAIPGGASLAGDWAPFFALGTGIKTLRIGGSYNEPPGPILRGLQIDYWLQGSTIEQAEIAKALAGYPGVAVGPPILEASYMGYSVALHPLRYSEAESPLQDCR